MTATTATVMDRVPGRIVDRDEVRDILPMAAAVVPLGFVVGVTIVALGIPRMLGYAGSPLLFSGSAQLTYLTVASSGAGLTTLAGALVLANSRLLIYSAALAPYFADQSAWFRWLTPTFIVDQTFLVATARPELRDPRRFRRYWLTTGAVLGSIWVTAILAGLLLGPVVPDALPLEIAAPALFVGLLVPRLTDGQATVSAVVAGTSAAIGFGPLGPASLPLAIGVGVAVVGLTDRVGTREPRS